MALETAAQKRARLARVRRADEKRSKAESARTRGAISKSLSRNLETVIGKGGVESIGRNIRGIAPDSKRGKGEKTSKTPARSKTFSMVPSKTTTTKKPAPANAKKPAKAKETFGQAFARERKAQGAGGTFTYKGKPFTTDRADDKPANAPRSAKKPAKAPEKKGFFSRLGDKFKKSTKLTGKPIKRSFQRGARMTPAERRKYDSAVKSYEEKPVQGKKAGGRVTTKKPTAKNSTAKKQPLARTSMKKKMPRRP